MTVTLLTFYFESYKGAVLIRPLQRFSGMTGQQMELTCYSTTHATRWANQQKYRTVCTHALNKRHPETWRVRNLACMFYSASQRVQRAITLCGMWVSEYELLITGSPDCLFTSLQLSQSKLRQLGNTILHCICVIVKWHESDSIDSSYSPDPVV